MEKIILETTVDEGATKMRIGSEKDIFAIVQFNVTDAGIAKMKADFLPLTIQGVGDKAGAELVRKSRIEVKNTRLDIQKKSKEYQAPAKEFVEKVKAEEKRILEELIPIEKHLQFEEDQYEAKKLEEEHKRKEEEKALVQRRVIILKSCGFDLGGLGFISRFCPEDTIAAADIAKLDETAFDLIVARNMTKMDKQIAIEEEAERVKQAELAELKRLADEEAARLLAIKMEEEARQAEIKAKADAEKAEKDRLEKEELARLRAEAVERDEYNRRKKEEEEAAEKADLKFVEALCEDAPKEVIEEAKQEALKFIGNRKLGDLLASIESIQYPRVSGEREKAIVEKVKSNMALIINYLKKEI